MEMSYGLYERAEERTASREAARYCFLEIIRARVPKVLEELRDGPLNIYLETGLNYPSLDYKNWGGRDWERTDIWNNIKHGASWLDAREIIFGRSILNWANRYNLIEEEANRHHHWLLNCVISTIQHWKHSPDALEQLSWTYPRHLWPGLVLLVKPPKKGLPEWMANLESREAYISHIREGASKRVNGDPYLSMMQKSHLNAAVQTIGNEVSELSKYLDRVEERYQSQGWKRVDNKKKLQRHMEWTVKFQVQGINYSQVARESKPQVTMQAIRKEINFTLALIGLQRRKGIGPGRPRD